MTSYSYVPGRGSRTKTLAWNKLKTSTSRVSYETKCRKSQFTIAIVAILFVRAVELVLLQQQLFLLLYFACVMMINTMRAGAGVDFCVGYGQRCCCSRCRVIVARCGCFENETKSRITMTTVQRNVAQKGHSGQTSPTLLLLNHCAHCRPAAVNGGNGSSQGLAVARFVCVCDFRFQWVRVCAFVCSRARVRRYWIRSQVMEEQQNEDEFYRWR